MPENIVERRRFPRLDYRIPISYRKIETNAPAFQGSLLKNISEGGAQITLYEFLPLNLKIAIEISLAVGTRPVRGTGRVAWIKKAAFNEQYDVGLAFLHLDEGDSSQIVKFIFNQSVEKVW